MREYNLQPLSPNMVKKPPLNDYAMAARAASGNIGSPAGLQPDGKLAMIDANLKKMQQAANAENTKQLAQLKASALNNQLNMAMNADKSAMTGLTNQANVEASENARNGIMGQIGDSVAALHGIAGVGRGLERLGAYKDADGSYEANGDNLRLKDGFMSRLAGGAGQALQYASSIGGLLPGISDTKREQLMEIRQREKTKAAMDTPEAIKMSYDDRIADTDKMNGYYADAIQIAKSGKGPIALKVVEEYMKAMGVTSEQWGN